VVPENIHTPHGRDLPYDPPPLWIFQNRPQKFTPPPLRNLIFEVNKEVVLFTRMPNFVSFMYCITYKRIPYANSLCVQVKDKFCAFRVISVEFYNSANDLQGCVANITVLFLHCVKKKATIKEIRTSSCDKTV